MPLQKNATDSAFKANVKAEIAAGKPQKQALAIAYRVQRDARKKKMSKGGGVGFARGGMPKIGPAMSPPLHVRNAARALERPGGIIASAVPGRSDRIPMSPKGGSYVIPADVVSAIGQGNTAAGANGLNRLFKMGPYGVAMPKVATPRRPRLADGGVVTEEAPVDIMAAGGEFVVPPEKVAELGNGDIDRGQNILDDLVKQARKKTVRTLRNLPGPRGA